MKSELIPAQHGILEGLLLADHSVLENAKVIEVWHRGVLIATVTGADGPGVRVLSKYPITAIPELDPDSLVQAITIRIGSHETPCHQ